jgi:hypothetical protein
MRTRVLVIVISITLWASILNVFPLNCTSQPVGWSNDVGLTYNTNNSVIPDIAVWDKYVHVFWCEQIPGPGSEYDLLYKRSSNDGKTWDSTIKLIDTPYHAILPSAAINQNTIHIVWRDDRESWLSAIYYMRSEDNGTTWTPEINITTPNGGTDKADIAIWGNKIYVVYMDGFQLYFIKSEDNGNTWGTPENITATNRDSNHPRITINGSNIHIVWMDHYDKNGNMQFGDIFYMNSTDSGSTWNEEQNLTPLGNNPLDSDYPDIVINGSILHVVYIDDRFDGIWRVHYRRSEDNGVTWSDDVTLSEPDSVVSSGPKIALSGNNLHVVWGDNRDGKWEIYYKHSSDNGYTWSEDLRLTFDDVGSATPSIASRENKVDVVWRDDRNSYPDIYYKHYPVPFPPTNLTIDIQGTHLILNWTPPKNSPSPVNHYNIYRSTSWNGFDFSFPWINTSVDDDNGIIPLRTTWNDTTGLLDENNNYFYIVRAIDAEGWNDTNTNIAGKYIIPMKKGWNLISLPLAQRNTSISKVLQTIDGNYDVIWSYDAKEAQWRSSTIDLTDINRTMGLWIHMKNAYNLSVVGAIPESSDITLYEGWNLVGYPSLETRNLNNALSGITWQAVQYYDAFDVSDPWKHNSTSKPDNLNDLKTMEPGRGYWVYVTINDTWIRTRLAEENIMVIWRVGGSEEEIVHYQPAYEPTIENPIEMKDNDDFQIDIIPEESTIKDEGNNLAISLIPLIILTAFILAEIKLLHKKKK